MLHKQDVAAMRMDYKTPIGFDETDLVAKEPFKQFDAWFREATKAYNVGEANAMILSTCGRLVMSFVGKTKTFTVLHSFHIPFPHTATVNSLSKTDTIGTGTMANCPS